ncbi:hypothetical protein [Aureispira sp. CCB-E]|uniref:hypothetical protein n=1 Tax=Aureispira sp. CCB-E TaxID=3051121 RepID=UPI0028690EFE|nr:hypothetical protein [Aureispira sp. CCB-E]WMX12413.1 hypothetical protein QP953_16410 [Aureispira sp. CCB-E]
MSNQNLKLSKGSQIAILGTHYKVTRTTILNVSKCRAIPQEQEEKEVQGNHQSDPQPDRTKRIACAKIEAKIKALEEEEYNALFDIEEDDPLFLSDRSEGFEKVTISEQLGRIQAINYLKEILKELQAI